MTTLTPDSTPAEVRKAWAERLRNPGDIVQGFEMLAPSTNERCCLGVLCDMAVEAGVIEGYAPSDGVPATKVDVWAGLDDDYDTGVSLAGNVEALGDLPMLNDAHGLTFADIADLLDDGLVLGPDGNVLDS